MYNEIVYTRCGSGLWLANGQRREGEGYKVYACSPELRAPGASDLELLEKVVGQKLPHDEVTLPDDGFVYVVPDIGGRIFLRFHQVYDGSRPFMINQAVVGGFDDVYPAALIEEDGLWTAMTLSEDDCRTKPFEPQSRRSLPVQENPKIFTEAAAFIAGGRRRILAQAAAFLLEQYALPPTQRRYLVIRDRGEREIELWIAAIEACFSPRMAAGLSFATRMDKIQNSNFYTVDRNGVYQNQMNLENPNQQLRQYAMVVGVAAADRDNDGLIVAEQNMPYSVLDGIRMEFSEPTDTSDRYYQRIGGFSEEQSVFCGRFLQSVLLDAPSKAILQFYTIFTILQDPAAGLKRRAQALEQLLRYPLAPTDYLSELAGQVSEQALQGMTSAPNEALQLLKQAIALADSLSLSEKVQEMKARAAGWFRRVLLQSLEGNGPDAWQTVRGTILAEDAAACLAEESFFTDNAGTISTMSPRAVLRLIQIYLEAQPLIGGVNMLVLQDLTMICLDKSEREEANLVGSLMNAVRGAFGRGAWQFWIDTADRVSRKTAVEIYGELLTPGCEAFASDDKILSFCQVLDESGKTEVILPVLNRYLTGQTGVPLLSAFFGRLVRMPYYTKLDVGSVCRLMDAHLVPAAFNSQATEFARQLDRIRPADVRCSNLAHILALSEIRRMVQRDRADEVLGPWAQQGFPSCSNAAYVDALCRAFVDNDRISLASQRWILQLLLMSEAPYYGTVVLLLLPEVKKQMLLWNLTIQTAGHVRNPQLYEKAVREISGAMQKSGLPHRVLFKAGSGLPDNEAAAVYAKALQATDRNAAEKRGIWGVFR